MHTIQQIKQRLKRKERSLWATAFLSLELFIWETTFRHVPQVPTDDGDVPQHEGQTISIGAARGGEAITWVKPDGLNLLIADRVLLAVTSWEDLSRNGFALGKRVLIDKQNFLCRLLQVGENINAPQRVG